MKQKRICIDINSITPLFVRGFVSGVGGTTFELVNALSEMKDELPFEIVLYSQNMKGIGGRNLNLPFKNKHLYLPHREKYNEFLGKYPVREIFTRYDLLHIPHNLEYVYHPEKTLVTLHDVLFYAFPDELTVGKEKGEKIKKLAGNCKAIVTCSESSKRDIQQYLNIKEEKITVIPWGVSTAVFYPENPEKIKLFKEKKGIKSPYFIMVSCNIGRKNTISLLKAYRLYLENKGNYELALVWKNPPPYILLEYDNEIKSGKVHFVDSLDTNDLRTAYSGAVCSFFPSKYEGFGLPILESMACGTPVVTCNNSSLFEVGQDMALYTEPEDAERMSEYMFDFENNNLKISRDDLLEHVKRYNWKDTAKKYVEFYQKNLD